MKVKYGKGITKYGPGVSIKLTGAEVATAIDAWLVVHSVHIQGPRTVKVNGKLCESGNVYVDPSGSVIYKGNRLSGRGPKLERERDAKVLRRLCIRDWSVTAENGDHFEVKVGELYATSAAVNDGKVTVFSNHRVPVPAECFTAEGVRVA